MRNTLCTNSATLRGARVNSTINQDTIDTTTQSYMENNYNNSVGKKNAAIQD